MAAVQIVEHTGIGNEHAIVAEILVDAIVHPGPLPVGQAATDDQPQRLRQTQMQGAIETLLLGFEIDRGIRGRRPFRLRVRAIPTVEAAGIGIRRGENGGVAVRIRFLLAIERAQHEVLLAPEPVEVALELDVHAVLLAGAAAAVRIRHQALAGVLVERAGQV